ncbi:hypothetical protein [Novipirellula artificiosorum]|uniref:Uncharacterized protein n=1 Tax=Novipirellula artificiosorum TaxID=2528016 RepID=A0A5C6DJZ2_9BACT|nr:hypothetical protein [Novipirellula artificiosorum]TWU35179.1 hypothetical protein Poly41_43280 [Novipirellula artificiosorum]
MNRWLMIGSLVGLLISSTGCLHHNLRGGHNSCGSSNCGSGKGLLGRLCGSGGDCQSCQTGDCQSCQTGSCQSGNCGSGSCGPAGCGVGSCLGGAGCQGCGRTGCVAGALGWQQGGLDYSSHLNPGLCGHGAGARLQSQPFTPGPPTGQVGYPYYTHHGPRDFLVDNPPTIGR